MKKFKIGEDVKLSEFFFDSNGKSYKTGRIIGIADNHLVSRPSYVYLVDLGFCGSEPWLEPLRIFFTENDLIKINKKLFGLKSIIRLFRKIRVNH